MTNQTIPPLLPLIKPLLKRNTFIYRILGGGYRHLWCGSLRIWRGICSTVKVMRNLAYRLMHQSDYQRWTNLHNYEEWWDSRTQKIARAIPPNSRVIEFGAGRRQLENFLDPTCSYVPSDILDRGPGTLVCDLNRRPFPDLSHLNVDTAVFGGVLEYLQDLESLAAWLSRQVSLCVVSYDCYSPREGVFRRLGDRFNRFYHGYMNGYKEDQFVDIFHKVGFQCVARDPWTSQRIFLFVKRRVTG